MHQKIDDQSRPLQSAAPASNPDIPPEATVVTAGAAKSSTLPVPYRQRNRWRWTSVVAAFAVFALAAGGAAYWWLQNQAKLPAGIVQGNGRIEADEIDISTKFAGRLAQLLVQEGDMLSPGQVVARMDTRDLEASLMRAESQLQQAQKAVDETRADSGTATQSGRVCEAAIGPDDLPRPAGQCDPGVARSAPTAARWLPCCSLRPRPRA